MMDARSDVAPAAGQDAASSTRETSYDVFISYSRRDIEFAKQLEKALRAYRPPRDLAVPQRLLRVFRDQSDFHGSEYGDALTRSLRTSASLLVICSPHAAASTYVADEVERFAEMHGAECINSVLLDGIPNNEAKDGEAARRAFPDALVQLLPVPLAADYRGFDTRRDRVRSGRFIGEWFKLIADIYAPHGVSRAGVEQRERRRRAKRLRIIGAAATAIAASLIGLTIWALISRNEAIAQRNLSDARMYDIQAGQVFANGGDQLVGAALLSVASLQSVWTLDGQISLAGYLALLPRAPAWTVQLEDAAGDDATGPGRKVLAVSPDGTRVAAATADGPVLLLDARTGRTIATIPQVRRGASRTTLAFSPDSRYLVAGCGPQACVIDAAAGTSVRRLPSAESAQGDMVWSAAFSPDGATLATASYHSNQVYLYDVATWERATTLDLGAQVLSVAFSPDGRTLATAGASRLLLWHTDALDAPAFDARIRGMPWGMAFDVDGEWLITAGTTLQAWRIVTETGGAQRLEATTERAIESRSLYAFRRRGVDCFTANAMDAVYVLCGTQLEEVLRIPLTSVAHAVDPAGRWLVNEENDGRLASWPLDGGIDALRVALTGSVDALAIAPEETWLAAGTDSGVVAVISSDDWTERHRLRLPAPVHWLSVSADGSRLAVAAGTRLHVLDTGDWRERWTADIGTDVSSANFGAGQALIAVADTSVIVFNAASGEERLRVEHEGQVEAIHVSADGATLATVTERSFTRGLGLMRPTRTRLLDVATGTAIGWIFHEAEDLETMAYLPRDSTLWQRPLAWGDTARVRASRDWPAVSLAAVTDEASRDSAWSAGVSGSTIALTRPREARPVATLEHDDDVNALAFLPSAAPRWLVSAGADGLLRAWPLAADRLIVETCARLRALLSEAAWQTAIADPRLVSTGRRLPCSNQ